jgi:hypothetical protein
MTALLTCVLASRIVKGELFVFGAGLLSLICLPTLYFNFGMGTFCGEPLAGFFIGTAFISLASFLRNLQQNIASLKTVALYALAFGTSLALAAYFRDIYTTFAEFCLLTLFLFALVKKSNLKLILAFILISGVTLGSLEYPWEKRNQKLFREFTMTGSTYYGYALWYFIWSDYKDSERWAYKSGHGLGNFLAPDKSADVLAKLEQNKKSGSLYAMQSLINAVMARPWEAVQYKLNAYPTLWFGRDTDYLSYAWCLVSTIFFLVYIGMARLKFDPELVLFPIFLICLSPLIHYEHRYSQPFFLFSTPIAIMYVLAHFKGKRFTKELID